MPTRLIPALLVSGLLWLAALDGTHLQSRDLMVINVTRETTKVRMATVDEYVLPPDVTEAYKKAPRTDEKNPSEYILSGKWKEYTPPPMPKK